MKTFYDCFEKGHGSTKKKKIVSRTKLKPVPNINFFGGSANSNE